MHVILAYLRPWLPIIYNNPFINAALSASMIVIWFIFVLQLYPAQLRGVLHGQCADISRVPGNYIRGAGTVRLDSFYPLQEATD